MTATMRDIDPEAIAAEGAEPATIHKMAVLSDCKILDDDSPEGTFVAFVNTTEILDAHNDIVHAGAWKKAIKKRVPKGVWSHRLDTWIAKATKVDELPPGHEDLPDKIREAGCGSVRVAAQFNLDTQAGRDAYANARFFGEQVEWSVGFTLGRGGYKWEEIRDDEGELVDVIRHIYEVDEWYEFSLVYAGASPMTALVDLKSRMPAAAAKVDAVLNLLDGSPDDENVEAESTGDNMAEVDVTASPLDGPEQTTGPAPAGEVKITVKSVVFDIEGPDGPATYEAKVSIPAATGTVAVDAVDVAAEPIPEAPEPEPEAASAATLSVEMLLVEQDLARLHATALNDGP